MRIGQNIKLIKNTKDGTVKVVKWNVLGHFSDAKGTDEKEWTKKLTSHKVSLYLLLLKDTNLSKW